MSERTFGSRRPNVGTSSESNGSASPEPNSPRVLWVHLAIISLVVSLSICRLAPVLSTAEMQVMGAWMRWRPIRAADERLAIVGITSTETSAFLEKQPRDCSCPTISRADLANVITRLKRAKTAVIGLDLRLESSCLYKQGETPNHDEQLAQALAQPGEIVLIASAVPTPERLTFQPPRPEFESYAQHTNIVASPVLDRQGDIRAVSLIQYGIRHDSQASPPPEVELVGQQFPPLCTALLATYRHMPDDLPQARSPYLVQCAGQNVPVWPSRCLEYLRLNRHTTDRGNHAMFINWLGPAGTVPTYSMTSILTADPQQLRERFADQIVIIGSLAERFYTPMTGRAGLAKAGQVDQSQETSMAGTEIHVQALDTLLTNRYIQPIACLWQIVIIVLLAFTAAALFQKWEEPLALVLTSLLTVSVFAVSYALMYHDIWLAPIVPATAIVANAAASAFWGFARVKNEVKALTSEVEGLESEVEVRDAVTATVVHDLKQPLSAIDALATVLRKRLCNEAAVASYDPELLDRIHRQVERAIGDIDDLLAATSNQEIGLLCQTFDLVELTRDLAEVQSLRSAYHKFEVSANNSPLWVDADVRYIGRVLSNLMDNAIKYWPEGGIIHIVVAHNPPWAEVRVVDQGLGISQEQIDRLFTPFERAVPEGYNIPGTGIGLYSVKRIITAHGGEVEVESKVGAGSTFIFRIPTAQAAEVEPEGGHLQCPGPDAAG